MKCSSCENEMMVVLGDRAFCEFHYQDLQKRQRDVILNYPRKPTEENVLRNLVRSCNRHDDCYKADLDVKSRGGIAAAHCHDEFCEECFGT